MSDSVISVENLSKSYLIGHQGPKERYHSLRDTVSHHVKNISRRTVDTLRGRQMLQGDSVEEFWALKDVSFEVKQGEVLGIIGRNGAGKSTLLKVLSRITEPTRGRVTIDGRVASLLEVGTGFHPELTGRENIFLNGAILGMMRREIRDKFDEIVEFAGVERFLDTPVKRYSSGMYVRLAFAVAAHLEPEILIVDEVLAVGDQQFQNKCMGKMREISSGGDRTVLFVSHNIGAIMSLCDRAIYLKSGMIQSIGKTSETVHAYLTEGVQQDAIIEFDAGDSATGDKHVRVWSARILGPSSEPQSTIGVADEASVEVVYEIKDRSYNPRVNLHFQAEDGEYAFASIQNNAPQESTGRFKCRMNIPANFLNGKSYRISIYVTSFQPTHVHVELKDIMTLNVIDNMESVTRQSYSGPFPGAVRPYLKWELDHIL